MCGHPSWLEALCDECFGKDREGTLTDDNICETCKHNLDRLCFVCDRSFDEPVPDNVCEDCKNE